MTTKSRYLLDRRRFITSLAAVIGTGGIATRARADGERIAIEVWKGPRCGCCKDWIAHLEANRFRVTYHDVGNGEARQRLGMPVRYGSCHTAEVAGYAVEGHVPATDILRLLQEKPDAVGLAVPGMPRGSPGMDGPAYGGVSDPYDVLLIDRAGAASVFTAYRG